MMPVPSGRVTNWLLKQYDEMASASGSSAADAMSICRAPPSLARKRWTTAGPSKKASSCIITK